jgi:hypothetical protein
MENPTHYHVAGCIINTQIHLMTASQASPRYASCRPGAVTGGTATVTNKIEAVRPRSSPFHAGGGVGWSGISFDPWPVPDVLTFKDDPL